MAETVKAGRQARDRVAKEVKAAVLLSRNNRASPVRKPSPLKAAVILPTTKANPTSIAKMQTVRRSRQDNGLIVPGAIVRTVEVGIVGAVAAAGIAEVGAVVLEVAAIGGLVVAVIAVIGNRNSSPLRDAARAASLF
jgi:hypothetical protein